MGGCGPKVIFYGRLPKDAQVMHFIINSIQFFHSPTYDKYSDTYVQMVPIGFMNMIESHGRLLQGCFPFIMHVDIDQQLLIHIQNMVS